MPDLGYEKTYLLLDCDDFDLLLHFLIDEQQTIY